MIPLRHLDQLQNAQFRILERILEKNNTTEKSSDFLMEHIYIIIYKHIMICIYIIIIIMIRCELGYHIVFPFSKHSSIFSEEF